MPSRARNGKAAQAGAADSISKASILRADAHDGPILKRMKTDHYTRVPLRGEFRQVDRVQLVLVVRGPQGSFVRQGYDVAELAPDELASSVAWARMRVALLDATLSPRNVRVSA